MKMMKINRFILLLLLFTPVALFAQQTSISISGSVLVKNSEQTLPFVNIVLKKQADSTFVSGTITNETGNFIFEKIKPGDFILEVSYEGVKNYSSPLFVGSNSAFLDLGSIFIEESVQELGELVVSAKKDAITNVMDKKTFSIDDNVSQGGGSVLQSMSNLPGITTQDGEVQLRGNNQIMILIDGKQTAITGFGKQNGLDNIPASAVEKIEIINNPSAKYDANGNGGIINIILKKENQDGFNGKLGLTSDFGSLWKRRENLPNIRPQYKATPKNNPSLSLNYRKKDVNFFLQADNLYTETLNRNEFVNRVYSDGTRINQQLKRNRDTNFFTSKTGLDWFISESNSLTFSGLFSQESIKDRGDQPFFLENETNGLRLWQFLEDEVLTAATASIAFEHKFQQPGHKLNAQFNYTFDREDEKYFFTNTNPTFTTYESFFLIADQTVADLSLDYTRPMKHGLVETGFKFRRRTIPTDMQFNPSSTNSVLDVGADGKASYKETIPALYGNFTYEIKKLEAEIGLRVEYVDLVYEVDPNHNTYQSDGYSYIQPFPNARVTYKFDDRNRVSLFYNRRVDRPDEVDIRIFPKYDDAEIIKVGNPALQPQFTQSFELGYKNDWDKGYVYGAVYHRISDGTITRIATTVDASNLIYTTSQNAGKSYNSGIELVLNQRFSERIAMNLNLNGYTNQIEAFTVENKYPIAHTFSAGKEQIYTGNVKWNTSISFGGNTEAQITAIYLAPDIIPQGSIDARFSIDFGIKKSVQNGKGEIFLNANDLFNTMVIRKDINGNNFSYTSANYYETQVIRLGYSYKF